MKNMRNAFFWGIGFLVIGFGCTTVKSRNDVSKLKKFYHNTTAHYNGYFNAQELMAASLESLTNGYEEDFNKLLPVYNYMANPNVDPILADMDAAVKKVTIVAAMHKPSDYTDDCYLLMGQAQFLKKDYEGAEETFRYLVNNFDPAIEAQKKRVAKGKPVKETGMTKMDALNAVDTKELNTKQRNKLSKQKTKQRKKDAKAKKKERDAYNKAMEKYRKAKAAGKATGPKPVSPTAKNDKDEEEKPAETPTPEAETPPPPPAAEPSANYFLKHRPAFQEGRLWLARTLIERDNYTAAWGILNELEGKSTTFESVREQIPAVKAYLLLKQKDYAAAATALDVATSYENDRDTKARYAYLLGQLHQLNNQSSQAYESFIKAAKYANDYDLAFNARLAAILNQSTSIEEARKVLEQLLADDKNAAYKDRIYYQLGVLEMKNNNTTAASEAFKKALEAGGDNVALQVEILYTLGQLQYKAGNYVEAKANFDNALNSMSPQDERYGETRRLSTNLTDIAKYIGVIEQQNQKLKLANLSPQERREKAKAIRDAQAAENAASNPEETNNPTINTAPTGLKASTFFAYDAQAISRGKRDFERVWGNRPLEDNWRRSNKAGSSGNPDTTTPDTETSTDDVLLTAQEVEQLLGEYPKTDQEKELTNFKVKEAYFNLGRLYRDRLSHYESSAATLAELDTKYPGSSFELDAWYLQFLNYTDLNQASKADEYRQKILNKFPQTPLGQLMRDPNYIQKIIEERRSQERKYEEAYALYNKGKQQEAMTILSSSRNELGGSHPLTPRLMLLMAMCRGSVEGKDAYIQGLNEVVSKYPNTDEHRKAKDMLLILGAAGSTLPGDQIIGKDNAGFLRDDDQLHYILVIFNQEVSLNDQKVALSDYNRKFHNLEQLRISNVYLGEELNRPVIIIRRFDNKTEAMKYYQGAMSRSDQFVKDAGEVDYEVFAIGQDNYREVLKQKTIDNYRQFFQDNYF